MDEVVEFSLATSSSAITTDCSGQNNHDPDRPRKRSD
nr:MAG TPA: hypothetical protein [Caudoviricetes sp.]